ncbi:MAG TPA: hypothetical protein VL863_03090 [bacterium]|nr:hypothetical protein [bacterium]
MGKNSSAFSAGDSGEQNGDDFKVLMVYEDLRAGLRGIQSINLLHEQMPPSHHLSTSLWRCCLLNDPLFSEKAAVEACEADLIILAAHGSGALPAEFHEWIERWLDLRHPRHYVICILADEGSSFENKSNAELTYLQDVAKAADADLVTSTRALPLPRTKLNRDDNISSPRSFSQTNGYIGIRDHLSADILRQVTE